MKRLVEVLGRTTHRYIVSTGPRHGEYELAPNMWGAEFLPQTRVIPLVDLVITHGGNNTVTEAFHFGTPMVVLPLFWPIALPALALATVGGLVGVDATGSFAAVSGPAWGTVYYDDDIIGRIVPSREPAWSIPTAATTL